MAAIICHNMTLARLALSPLPWLAYNLLSLDSRPSSKDRPAPGVTPLLQAKLVPGKLLQRANMCLSLKHQSSTPRITSGPSGHIHTASSFLLSTFSMFAFSTIFEANPGPLGG